MAVPSGLIHPRHLATQQEYQGGIVNPDYEKYQGNGVRVGYHAVDSRKFDQVGAKKKFGKLEGHCCKQTCHESCVPFEGPVWRQGVHDEEECGAEADTEKMAHQSVEPGNIEDRYRDQRVGRKQHGCHDYENEIPQDPQQEWSLSVGSQYLIKCNACRCEEPRRKNEKQWHAIKREVLSARHYGGN